MYVFPVEGFDRNIADEKLIKAHLKKKRVERYTLKEFIEALNDEHINIDNYWVRMIDDSEGNYPIASLFINNLKEEGFDTKKVTESNLKTLADKMSDDYYYWMYWDSLRAIADEIGIPRQKKSKKLKTSENEQISL